MNIHHSSRLATVVLSTGMLALACGGGDGLTDVGPNGIRISDLAGTWNATVLHYFGLGPSSDVRIVANGGSGTLVLQADGRFTFTTVILGEAPQVTTGKVAFDAEAEDFLQVLADGETEADEFFFQFDGTTMRLDGETDFDFDKDGVPDPAQAEFAFVRQ